MQPGQKMFYYVQTSGGSEKPLRIDLIPTTGNMDLEITIISELSASKSVWKSLSSTPTYTSESQRGLDTIVLDAETHP